MGLFSGYMLGRMSGGSSVPGGAAVGFFGLFVIAFILIAFLMMGLSLLMPFVSAWLLTVNTITLDFYNPTEFVFGWGVRITFIAIGVYSVITAYNVCFMGSIKQFLWAGAFLALLNFLILYDINLCIACDDASLLSITHVGLPKNAPPYIESFFTTGPLACLLVVIDAFLLRLIVRRFVSADKRAIIIARMFTPYRVVLRSRVFAIGLMVIACLTALSQWRMLQIQFGRIDRFVETTNRSFEEGFAFVFESYNYGSMVTIAVLWTLAAIASLIYARWTFKRRPPRIKTQLAR